jgi:hypothetical protein
MRVGEVAGKGMSGVDEFSSKVDRAYKELGGKFFYCLGRQDLISGKALACGCCNWGLPHLKG